MLSRWRVFLLFVCLISIPFSGCGEAPLPNPRRPLVDSDGDGYNSLELGGRDCQDEDPGVNPLSKENITNKKDDNCNGQIDEFTADTGHWRLTTTDAIQKDSLWHLELRTNAETGVQFIRCIQFRVLLKSPELNRDTTLNLWLSGIPPGEAKIENNRFDWIYKNDKGTEEFQIKGQITSEKAMTATITIKDSDINVKGQATVALAGAPEAPNKDVKDDSDFCARCYGDATCKLP